MPTTVTGPKKYPWRRMACPVIKNSLSYSKQPALFVNEGAYDKEIALNFLSHHRVEEYSVLISHECHATYLASNVTAAL